MNAPRGKCAQFSIYCTFLSIGFYGRRKPLYVQYGRARIEGKTPKARGFPRRGGEKISDAKTRAHSRAGMRAAGGYRCGGLPAASASPLSRLKRMEISRVTPRSCIVTPYIVRAADIVRLLCEITRNCE